MKHFLIVLFCSIIVLNYSLAQTTVKIQEPAWEGEIVYENNATGNGIALERQEVAVKTQADAIYYLTGLGKIRTTCSAKKSASNVRTENQGGVIQFVCRLENNKSNPKKVIQVYEFKANAKTRTLETGSLGALSGASSGGNNSLEFKAEAYGTNSYLITIFNLKPGEYAFSLGEKESRTMYFFGVD